MDVLTTLASALASNDIRIVDLTRTLSTDDPSMIMPPEFGQSWPVRIEEISRYNSVGPSWYWNNISFGEHTGTHLDAPAHWFTGRDLARNTVDTMPLEPMLAPVCVIDCVAEAADDPDFLLSKAHVLAWEGTHGRIAAGTWVFMHTGWGNKTGAAYANLDDTGAHTPGPNAEAMRFLIDERDILGFGTETIGTDCGQAGHMTPPYPAHNYLHGAGKYGLQCLTGVDALPPTGAMIFAAPLKILAGSGSPLRVLALVPAVG